MEVGREPKFTLYSTTMSPQGRFCSKMNVCVSLVVRLFAHARVCVYVCVRVYVC